MSVTSYCYWRDAYTLPSWQTVRAVGRKNKWQRTAALDWTAPSDRYPACRREGGNTTLVVSS